VTKDDDATTQVAVAGPLESGAAPLIPVVRPTGFGYLVPREGSFPRVFMALALIALGIYALFGSPFVILIGQSCAVYAVASMGQSLLMGSAGQIAISGGAFMAIGAFTTGMLVDTPLHAFPLPLIISVAVGWMVGLAAGLPGLRFRGLYLLLASLALQFIVTSITERYEADYHPAGLVIPPLNIGSINLSSGKSLYIALLIILLIVCAVIWLIERTGIGLAWRALRESEVAAAISGIDIVRWKLYAFAASGAITAAAGCLFAYLVGIADYSAFDLTLSISLITMIFIGGIGSRLGALVGAVVITTLPYILRSDLAGWMSSLGLGSAGWYTNNESEVNAGLFSLLFLLVVLFEPRGIEGLLAKAESGARRLVQAARGKKAQEAA
jgi:branched-chain amino acid transport system permease protein